MTDLTNYALKFANIKCIGDEPQGFDTIKPINIIIGRNNSGKSTLLDLFPALTRASYEPDARLSRQTDSPPIAKISIRLTAELLGPHFPHLATGSPYSHTNFHDAWTFAEKYLVGKQATFDFKGMDAERADIAIEGEAEFRKYFNEWGQNDYKRRISQAIPNPFENFTFHRISPERSLKAEQDQNSKVHENGDGGTNEIQRFLNKDGLPPDLVSQWLLRMLNSIVTPDAEFTQIVTRQIDKAGKWEVFLREEKKGLIPLSKSGHGLQTIILVLVHTLLKIYPDKDHSKHIFAFEELENNLHPALLRRLLDYIRRLAINSRGTFFITTHSHVVIDMFRRDENAQIIHVVNDGHSATCRTLTTYIEHGNVLDDLDVRASDILQANCVIWVEGPSDRIYLNRWIELASNGELREGTHYQCVFYGGRLLAHLSGKLPDDEGDDAVKILTLNRRACVVMDSDKRTKDQAIGKTKERIVDEIAKVGGLTWITAGKEVENYVPAKVIEQALGLEKSFVITPYADVFSRLDKVEKGVGKRERDRKPLFAERVAEALTVDNWKHLDLENRLGELCEKIHFWNGNRE
ncbi:ATP-dependent nuclease [Bremerella alba]|uniref:Endonuclease GajA/Old nuclease/RecF-like AAA domain-containing protein n=1 Tax=Bremerella alba TaxID=980252 RepID=A0A7V9A967_9BACT|nr:ATP-binding protein [Bremerella alba]MBA2116826.1 hypothetical protein [Bremerella alba]